MLKWRFETWDFHSARGTEKDSRGTTQCCCFWFLFLLLTHRLSVKEDPHHFSCTKFYVIQFHWLEHSSSSLLDEWKFHEFAELFISFTNTFHISFFSSLILRPAPAIYNQNAANVLLCCVATVKLKICRMNRYIFYWFRSFMLDKLSVVQKLIGFDVYEQWLQVFLYCKWIRYGERKWSDSSQQRRVNFTLLSISELLRNFEFTENHCFRLLLFHELSS